MEGMSTKRVRNALTDIFSERSSTNGNCDNDEVCASPMNISDDHLDSFEEIPSRHSDNRCGEYNRLDRLRKRRIQALDEKSIAKQLQSFECGCSLKCQEQFTSEQILFWREMVHILPIGEARMAKIKEILRTTSVTSPEKHKKNQVYKVEQNMACRKFFIDVVLFVSESTICRAKQNLHSSTGICRAPKQLTHAAKGNICIGFIKAYVESTCDRDPTGTVFRMPVSLSKLDIFSLYEVVYKESCVKKSMFYQILKEKFQHVVFSKSQKYTKCKDCNEYRELIAAERNPELKKEMMRLRDLHLKEQQMEREAYYVRRAQAEMRQGEILSIILDGMDQQKTNLPSYAYGNNPVGSGQRKLKTHITGSIVHGRGKYFFVDCNQYPHDTNLTLSCLLKILVQEATDGKLPSTLYIQLDNTCRENKNKYFLGMMGLLVKLKVVREIWISFLIVGHTHEDVDQCFSRISVKMKPQNTFTLSELHNVIEMSQKPVPKSNNVGTVWNISGWLSGFVSQIHNVTQPKMYRIYLDSAEHVTIKYKVLSTDDEWHPNFSEKPLEIFRIENGCQVLPVGEPDIVQPVLAEEDVEDLKRSVEKDFLLAHFKERHILEWQTLFSDIQKSSSEEWPLAILGECGIIPQQMSSLSEKEKEILARYKAKRDQFKQVYTSYLNGDRRKYFEGDLIVYKESGINNIGEILKISEGNVEIEELQQHGQKFVRNSAKRKLPIDCCHPGSFELRKDSTLPKRIKNMYF